MLLVEPVVIRPLLAEWAAEKTEIAAELERAETAKASATRTKRRNEARRRYRAFLNRLRGFTVLDPACGSGNFLYLALQALKDLEHRVQLEAEADLGCQRAFPEVGPANVKGICPGSLAEQWQDELYRRFQLPFEILTNDKLEAARTRNWFLETDLVIARLDKLPRDEEVQQKLQALDAGWDLVVCDEAHKLSATFFGGEVKYTKRYRLGQLLSGLTHHFLLMTATPHNGKEQDFQLFLALLDGERFECRFRDGVHTADVSDRMRRMVKERLLKFDGKPLFLERIAYTVPYRLFDEDAHLYTAVTDHVREDFNRAEALANAKRAGTVGFALTILQRRLASSPEATYQSLRRRRERLESRLHELDGLDRDQVRDWYNGYSWRGEDKVYNPFDILLLFDTREFAAHWFETGTPTFLVDTLSGSRVSSLVLDEMAGSADLRGRRHADRGAAVPDRLPDHRAPGAAGRGDVLPAGVSESGGAAEPDRSLLNRMTGDASRPVAHSAQLYDLLVNDFAGLAALVESFFASIPCEWYTNNDIASYEGFLRQRVLLVLRGAGAGRGGRGHQQPRPPGHGVALQRQRLPVRVQGGGAGARGRGDRAVESEGLRGQVPRPRRADPPNRGGVQQGGPQPGGVRRRAGLTRGIDSPSVQSGSGSAGTRRAHGWSPPSARR